MDNGVGVARVYSNEEGHRSQSEQQLSRDDTISNNTEQDTVAVKRMETINRQHDRLPSQEPSSPLSMGAGKPYPQDLLDKDSYLVEFDGPSDPAHPQNWSTKKKLVQGRTNCLTCPSNGIRLGIVLVIASTTFITTFGSGIFSPAISTISEKYHIAPEAATLGVTLYVLGFSAGYVFTFDLVSFFEQHLPLVCMRPHLKLP